MRHDYRNVLYAGLPRRQVPYLPCNVCGEAALVERFVDSDGYVRFKILNDLDDCKGAPEKKA